MNAQTVAPPRHRHRQERQQFQLHPAYRWVLPIGLGLFYGGYVGWLDHGEGASMGSAEVNGLISAGVMIGLLFLLSRNQGKLMPELRAAAYGALIGCAFGYLYVTSGATNFKASGMGLLVGLGATAVAYYIFHTLEERRRFRSPRPLSQAETEQGRETAERPGAYGWGRRER